MTKYVFKILSFSCRFLVSVVIAVVVYWLYHAMGGAFLFIRGDIPAAVPNRTGKVVAAWLSIYLSCGIVIGAISCIRSTYVFALINSFLSAIVVSLLRISKYGVVFFLSEEGKVGIPSIFTASLLVPTFFFLGLKYFKKRKDGK